MHVTFIIDRLIILAKREQHFQGFRGRGSKMDHTMWIALNNIQNVEMKTQSSVYLLWLFHAHFMLYSYSCMMF